VSQLVAEDFLNFVPSRYILWFGFPSCRVMQVLAVQRRR